MVPAAGTPELLPNVSCCRLQQTLSTMKAHAHDLLESILANPNITDSDLMGLPEEHKSDLRKRVQAADLVSEGLSVGQCCRLYVLFSCSCIMVVPAHSGPEPITVPLLKECCLPAALVAFHACTWLQSSSCIFVSQQL